MRFVIDRCACADSVPEVADALERIIVDHGRHLVVQSRSLDRALPKRQGQGYPLPSVIQIDVVQVHRAQGRTAYFISDLEDLGRAGVRNDSDTPSWRFGGDRTLQ